MLLFELTAEKKKNNHFISGNIESHIFLMASGKPFSSYFIRKRNEYWKMNRKSTFVMSTQTKYFNIILVLISELYFIEVLQDKWPSMKRSNTNRRLSTVFSQPVWWMWIQFYVNVSIEMACSVNCGMYRWIFSSFFRYEINRWIWFRFSYRCRIWM